MNYKKKISLEGKAFDKQVRLRKKFGLIPDLRKLKKNYNFYNNPWREPEFFKIQWMKIINRIIKDASSKKKNQKILEIGCGTGFLSLELARFGNNVLGIDVSKKSIAEAQNYLKKIDKKKKLKLNYEVKDAHKIDFNEKFVFKASDLGQGTHKISAEAFASWQKHDFTETGSIKNSSSDIEITIN